MIETELTFFKIQMQGGAVETAKLGQTHLGETPEVLDAVDVRLVLHKFIAAVIDAMMLLVTQVHQAAVTLPAVRIDHAAQDHLALQNGRQHCAAAMGDDLRINLPVAFEPAEDRHFLKSSPVPVCPGCGVRQNNFRQSRPPRAAAIRPRTVAPGGGENADSSD
jgi:hypothetical protein